MPSLEFKGKQHIYAHHLTVPYRQLVPDDDRSLDPAGADDNLIVHGDNLEALKALLPRYAERVKCIYIDPPYNTGNEGWSYNDNVNSPLMQDWLERNGAVDGEDLERHEKWLCMMWPRLQLLKDLLAEDGVIFVSIDDNEVHHLRMMMDEIFGEESYIGTFVWEGTGKNDAASYRSGTTTSCVMREGRSRLKTNDGRWRARKEGIDEIYRFAERLQNKHPDEIDPASDELMDWFAALYKLDPLHGRTGIITNLDQRLYLYFATAIFRMVPSCREVSCVFGRNASIGWTKDNRIRIPDRGKGFGDRGAICPKAIEEGQPPDAHFCRRRDRRDSQSQTLWHKPRGRS